MILLIIEKRIRGGICHVIHRYALANHEYMKNIDRYKELLYLIYLDVNNLYGWVMFQKLPVNGFEWVNNISKFNEKFIKNYNEDSDKRCILDVDVEYLKRLQNLPNDLPFLPKRMRIKERNKRVRNLHDKNNYVAHI